MVALIAPAAEAHARPASPSAASLPTPSSVSIASTMATTPPPPALPLRPRRLTSCGQEAMGISSPTPVPAPVATPISTSPLALSQPPAYTRFVPMVLELLGDDPAALQECGRVSRLWRSEARRVYYRQRAPRSCRHLVALLDTAHRNPTLARHLIQLDMGQVPLLYWPISHREPPVPGVVYPLSWPALRLAPTLMRGGPFNHVARLSVQAIAWDTLQTLVESMPQLQNLCAREIWQAAGSGMAPFDQIGVRAPTGVQAPDGADGDDATTDAASELTRALAPWRRLRVLRLEWQQRDIAGFASADFLDRFLIPLAGNMTAVQLCSRETVTDTAFVHLMTASPHLRTLVLDTWTSHLSIDAVRELLARGAFAPFTSLHLRFADWILGFTQKDLVAILLQARACLQLDLSGFEAPDDQHACADHLLYAVARHAPQYTALLLPHDMPGVTRTAVRFLLKRLRHLTAIQMPCLLGARELELIVDRNPDLTHLSLRGCEGLDTDTVLALLARLPRLIALDIRDTAIAIPVDALRKRHMMPALQRIEGGAAFRGWAVLASRLAGVCVHAHATVWRDFEMRAMCTCDFGREENDYLEPALADAALAADADTEDATTAPPSPFFVGVDAADQVSPLPVPSAPDIQLVLDAGHSR